jgi:hypothetical protein
MKKKKKRRQPATADDDWGSWFPASLKTEWADTHRPLTRAELLRAIRTGTTKRPLEISVRVPKGTETVALPAGRNIFEADGFLDVICKAIGNRLRRRKRASREQMREQFQLMCKIGKIAPKKLRAQAIEKLTTGKKFRHLLENIDLQSQIPFTEALLVRFMWMNWDWPATANNPKCQDGLRALKPKEALDLMKAEGYFVAPSCYRDGCDWYRTTRRRLKLKPLPR